MTNQFPDATKIVFPPNDLSHLSDEEFNALAPVGYHATGQAEPLSPAAQAVMNATDYPEDWATRIRVAAALRAVADQVVPKDTNESQYFTNEAIRLNRMGIRQTILAIADELDNIATH